MIGFAEDVGESVQRVPWVDRVEGLSEVDFRHYHHFSGRFYPVRHAPENVKHLLTAPLTPKTELGSEFGASESLNVVLHSRGQNMLKKFAKMGRQRNWPEIWIFGGAGALLYQCDKSLLPCSGVRAGIDAGLKQLRHSFDKNITIDGHSEHFAHQLIRSWRFGSFASAHCGADFFEIDVGTEVGTLFFFVGVKAIAVE